MNKLKIIILNFMVKRKKSGLVPPTYTIVDTMQKKSDQKMFC